MSAADKIRDSLAEHRLNKFYYERWQRDNKVEAPKVIAYLDGGSRPADGEVGTHYGRGLVLAEDARRELGAPPPPPDPPPVGDRLRWAPPALTNPETRNVTGAGTISLQSGRDYILNLNAVWSSSSSGRSSIAISGGRHVVIIGGRVAYNPTNTTDDAIGLLIDGGDTGGIVHIEGVDISAPNGITVRTPRVLQIQNCRITARALNDAHGSIHPDVVQVWKGHKSAGIRVHRLTASSAMTFLSDLTDEPGVTHGTFTPSFWELHDVDLHSVGNALNVWMGHPQSTVWRGSNLWLETSTEPGGNRRDLGDQLRQFGEQYNPKHAGYEILDAVGNVLYTQQPGIASGAPGDAGRIQGHRLRYLNHPSHPGIAGLEWRCQTPPSGDFVPQGLAGTSYVPPGYA